MISRRLSTLLILLVFSLCAFADEKSTKLTDDDRKELIRSFMAEMVFAHRPFPMGKVGLRIQDGVVTPSEGEVTQLIAQYGPALKAGDRGKITDVRFVKNGIIFELNGGPVKKKKWYERVSIGMNGAETTANGKNPMDDPALYSNARGSFVLLAFKNGTPSVRPDEIKQMLAPVFDFNAMTVAEAYAKALPPHLADAIKNHKALVGMDREMVGYAKGRPPKKYRDRAEDGQDYEEWIYGQPPQEMEFVRFVGDKVVKIVTMKIDGEKIIRTQDEVGDIGLAAAKKDEQQKQEEGERRAAPSLVRPGEETVKADQGARPRNPVPSQTTPQGGGYPSPTGLPDGPH